MANYGAFSIRICAFLDAKHVALGPALIFRIRLKMTAPKIHQHDCTSSHPVDLAVSSRQDRADDVIATIWQSISRSLDN